MRHLDQFILYMGCLLSAVIVSGNGSSADEDIAYAYFTSAVGLSVIAGKTLNQNACEFVLAI